MPKDSYTEADLKRQAMAAKSLLEEIASDDEDLNHDMVEGETDFFETVERALDEIADAEVIVEGCKAMLEKLARRKNAAEARITALKTAIDQAFQIAELSSHKFPTATVTSKKAPPKLIVNNEAEVPSKFFRRPDPVLDKKALLDALKGGEEVPGATLSNGGMTIQIRRV